MTKSDTWFKWFEPEWFSWPKTCGEQGEVAVNNRVDVRTYTSLHKLVNDMFPAQTYVEQVCPPASLKEITLWNSVLYVSIVSAKSVKNSVRQVGL
jgi:hypothetical protein